MGFVLRLLNLLSLFDVFYFSTSAKTFLTLTCEIVFLAKEVNNSPKSCVHTFLVAP